MLHILAVDFSHLWFRNYKALGGEDAGECRKRTLQSIAVIREGYDRVALMTDDGASFRKGIEPGYKADRERQDAPFYEQRRLCIERLESEGCLAFQPPEVLGGVNENGNDVHLYAEADDLCASLAAWCIANGHACDIYTDDKDMMQCVDDAHGIRVVRPGNDDRSGVWDAARVQAKYGVPPSLVVDWLVLGGDKSDGYKMFPGWEDAEGRHPGISAITAAKLLTAFGAERGALGVIDALEAKDADDKPANLIKGHVAEVLRRGQPTPLAAVGRGQRLAMLLREPLADWSTLLAEPVYAPLVEDASRPQRRETATVPATEQAQAPEVTGEPVPAKQTALVRHVPIVGAIDRLALQPRNVDDLRLMAVDFYESNLYGKFTRWQAIAVVMIEANERGIPVGLALRNCYVVHGVPAWSAVFLGALVLSSGRAKLFRIVESTNEKAVLEYQRHDETVPSRFEFTIEEARVAKWIKKDGKWETNPRLMLRYAAIREGARSFFFDVVAGMATPDEVRKDGTMTDDEWEHADAVQ